MDWEGGGRGYILYKHLLPGCLLLNALFGIGPVVGSFFMGCPLDAKQEFESKLGWYLRWPSTQDSKQEF